MADQSHGHAGAVSVAITPTDDPTGTRQISVSGEIDLSTCEPLRKALDDVIDAGADRIELDVKGLGFIDSTGLGVLVAALKRMQAKGGQILLQSPAAPVMRVLEITGLSSLFVMG